MVTIRCRPTGFCAAGLLWAHVRPTGGLRCGAWTQPPSVAIVTGRPLARRVATSAAAKSISDINRPRKISPLDSYRKVLQPCEGRQCRLRIDGGRRTQGFMVRVHDCLGQPHHEFLIRYCVVCFGRRWSARSSGRETLSHLARQWARYCRWSEGRTVDRLAKSGGRGTAIKHVIGCMGLMTIS